MEEWYTEVRRLKDESEDRILTKNICDSIYQYFTRTKIKEKTKFKERMGIEFEKFTSKLADKYSETYFNQIIRDDEFWDVTVKTMLKTE